MKRMAFSPWGKSNAENRQSTTPTVHSTTSDDIRYDLTFFTPSGLEVRVKVI